MQTTVDRVGRRFGWVSRRTLAGLAILAATGTGLTVWQLGESRSPNASIPTVRAARGELVVFVRARGKVVDARAAVRGAPIGSAGSGAAGGAPSAGGQAAAALPAVGTSQPIFAQTGGRVTALLVSPGRLVAAGQVLARLDRRNARVNLVAAQAALDQAKAQLQADRMGVTPQSLAAANAAITTAVAAVAGAKDAFRHGARVNRDAVVSASEQVAQAKAQLAVDRQRLGPSPQATLAATAAVTAARSGFVAARAALADLRAVNAQQTATAANAVTAAGDELAADQSKLVRDLATERRFCGTTSPVIATDTSSECANAASTVESDRQAIVKDQSVVQAAQDAAAQAKVNAAQSEHQAQAQLAAAVGSLQAARDQLAVLTKTNAQTVAKDRRLLVAARSALAQARSKALESRGQARAQVKAASVGLTNARLALVALEQGAPGPLIAQDRSKIVAAQAQIGAARAAVTQTVVRAPTAGTVTWVFVSPGSVVDTSTPVAAIADLTHLAVSLDLSEFDAARVRRGMSAVVNVDALGGKSFPGRVVFEAISGVDNGGVVTFPLRVALAKAPGVRIGMNVSARIVVARRHNVVLVPLEALTRDDRGRSLVSVVDATRGGVSTRIVTLGLANNKDVEVVHGLRAGDRVELQPPSGP